MPMNNKMARKKASCEECGRTFFLKTVDADGVLIGDECVCGHYVTRYMPGMKPKGL